MYCTRCGKKIPEDSTFCPLCGENLLTMDQNNTSENANENSYIKEDKVSFSAKKKESEGESETEKTTAIVSNGCEVNYSKKQNLQKTVKLYEWITSICIAVQAITSAFLFNRIQKYYWQVNQ